VTKTVLAAAALLLAAGGPAWSQPAKPEGAAEAKAAMERAQRLAANPMKVILQAGKIRRKGEPEGASEPADAAATRRLAVPSATAPAPLRVVAPAAEASEGEAPKQMPSSLLPAAPAAPLPALETAPAAVDTAPALARVPAPQALAADVAVPTTQPVLLSMIEPNIPARLLSETGRVNDVLADLNLRADGSVAEVILATPVPRSWRGPILAALQQWRFQALPSARVHRVQLVFDER